jgi:hypothetical protein
VAAALWTRDYLHRSTLLEDYNPRAPLTRFTQHGRVS